MKLFLCAYFAGVVDIFKHQIQPNVHGKKVLFIPTAAKVEEYNEYVDEAQIAFEKLGWQIQLLDISEASEDEIKREMSKAEVLYVSGGNTFYLLSELKKKNLLPVIRSCIDLGMVYIGESAGAIIASQDISYISIMDDVVFGDNLGDFNALDIVEFDVLPHYGEFPFKEATQEILDTYGNALNLIPINNSEAIIVNDGEYTILGR